MNAILTALSADLKEELVAYLTDFVTPHRRAAIERVVRERTRRLTIVLEEIYQPHNASAALRTCECFGIQDVHIIEAYNEYRVNKDIAVGASRWLTLRRHGRGERNRDGAISACLHGLKAAGYRIVAASLAEGGTSLPELSVADPLALCFGTEEAGLSETAHALADETVTIPMSGFTQSLNVSVSLAICCYELTRKLRSEGVAWRLSDAECIDLSIEWLIRSATRGDALVRHFFKEKGLALPV